MLGLVPIPPPEAMPVAMHMHHSVACKGAIETHRLVTRLKADSGGLLHSALHWLGCSFSIGFSCVASSAPEVGMHAAASIRVAAAPARDVRARDVAGRQVTYCGMGGGRDWIRGGWD